MNLFFTIGLLALIALGGVLVARARTLKGCGYSGAGPVIDFANIAEGIHPTGRITKKSDVAITERYLLAKIGAAADSVNVAGAADVPIGVIVDEAAAINDTVTVFLLGGGTGTVRMVASGAITQGSLIEPAASGRVQTKSGAAGNHYVVGRALDAAANAGDVIEVDPFTFLQVI